MDAQSSGAPSTVSTGGGTVEPMNRAAIAKAKFQTPRPEPQERYELRDPFADVTYRSRSLDEIIAKAEQLGSRRFVALTEDGKRTPVTLSGSEWHRGKQLAVLPERPLDAVKDEPELTVKAPKAGRAGIAAQPLHGNAQLLVKIDTEAERTAKVERLEAELRERYIIKRAPVTVGPVSIGHTEYRFRGDTSRIAFTESTFRLATDTNSPSVARSMVDVAQARDWKALRISGSEDFRRLVWLEATVRGVKAIGYEPNPADLDVLKRERAARQTNRIEEVRAPNAGTSAAAEKASSRGGGRKAVVAAIEAVLLAKGIPESKRSAVLAAAEAQLTQRIRAGQAAPKVKVYDKAAPSQQPAPIRAAEATRSRDRATPTHAR